MERLLSGIPRGARLSSLAEAPFACSARLESLAPRGFGDPGESKIAAISGVDNNHPATANRQVQ
jgi:hypothetical protein